jgi:hypothetical protein
MLANPCHQSLPWPSPASLYPNEPLLSSLAPFQDGIRWKVETEEDGLLALRVSPRAHARKKLPDLPGKYFKYFLEKPPVDFLVGNNRGPYVLMHMRKPAEAVPPATAVDEARTPADAHLPETLAAGSATAPDHLLQLRSSASRSTQQ